MIEFGSEFRIEFGSEFRIEFGSEFRTRPLIFLLLCATESGHNFSNFDQQKNNYIDYFFVYDTGLSDINKKTLIDKNFKILPGYFDNNFGQMRNRALKALRKYSKNDRDIVIMPDDSWSLENFSADLISPDFDYYLTKIHNKGLVYDVIRIFRINNFFTTTKRNEEIMITRGDRIKFLGAYFVDNFIDVDRTRKINKDIKPEDFKDLFHAGNWFYLEGDIERAKNCYTKRYQELDTIDKRMSEEKFLILCYLALIFRDINFYLKATEYSPRAAEACYYIYLITKDPKYLVECKKCPIDLSLIRLPVNTDIINKIKNICL